MAHASVASLMRTIESLLISNSPVESLICDHREEFCALHKKVSSLEVFLKNFEKSNVSGEMTGLETQIKKVANVVEHIIQLRITEVVMENDEMLSGKAQEKLSDSLQQVGEDIDRVWEESTKIQDKGKQVSKESLVQDFSSSTKDILNVKRNMVGCDDQRKRLLKDLTRDYSGEPKVIPIIGMGGIGKTTLAREVYNDACIRSHFDVCAWATLSQQPNIREILLSLLHSTIKMDDTVKMKGEAELRDKLQKSLKGKRYLIVMDDIWNSEVWNDMRLCFPSEKNNAGSRILLTTRNNEVACNAGSENFSLQMGFMGPNDSWNLFESIAFFNEALPSEFETIGKQIVNKCHGLPLTIVVVAGFLKSKRTIEYWENVAENVKSITNDPDKQCLDVLGLSYNHLSSDLKACLLYFGKFREDTEVPVKKLMRYWMAEGFLNLEKDLEGEAEKCLQELMDRCLVLASKKSQYEKKIRSCKVHDLIYDLCLRESDAIKAQSPSKSQSLISRMNPFKCWTCDEIDIFPSGLYRAILIPGRQKCDRTLSFIVSNLCDYSLEKELIDYNLLKVLDLGNIEINDFPLQLLSLIWLRYLALSLSRRNFEIPTEICRLWNLQTFIVRGWSGKVTFPEQIWRIMQLRHLTNMDFYNSFVLPKCPNISDDREKNMGLSNIQTISGLSPHCCTKEVILGIQNVKKLGIQGDRGGYESFWNNLVHLHQLESLSLADFVPEVLPSANVFPATLKKLKLYYTKLSWSVLDIIAELPNLEVLKLMENACHGEEWDLNVNVFTRLKILLIDSHCDLKYWNATNDNFPFLERVFIRNCPKLEEIPIEFVEIHSLQLIELEKCNSKLAVSAETIQQEQEDLGNNPVVVVIKSPRWPSDDDEIEEEEDEDDDDVEENDVDDGDGD